MSESVIKKRLFVGGLGESVSEDELKERFARFGSVSNLTLKSRTDDEGNHIKSFAHLDIRGTEESIKKCFSAYQNAKWKGCVMKLQDAKENVIERLETERQEDIKKSLEPEIPDKKKKEDSEWKPPVFDKLNGAAVPGTPVPGKKDWVVGKYGRVVPILNVKKSYKIKAVKHDPSKFCHAAKVFKEDKVDTVSSVHTNTLTWEIETPDSEITKKRKGIFPPSSLPVKKPKPFPVAKPVTENNETNHQSSSSSGSKISNDNPSSKHKSNDEDDLQIVKVGLGLSSRMKTTVRSKFDSDYESDDDELVVPVNKKDKNDSVDSSGHKKNMKSPSSQSSKKIENNLEPKQQQTSSTSKVKKKGKEKCVKEVVIEKTAIPEFKGIGSLITKTADKGSSKSNSKSVSQTGSDKSKKMNESNKKSAQSLSSNMEVDDEEEEDSDVEEESSSASEDSDDEGDDDEEVNSKEDDSDDDEDSNEGEEVVGVSTKEKVSAGGEEDSSEEEEASENDDDGDSDEEEEAVIVNGKGKGNNDEEDSDDDEEDSDEEDSDDDEEDSDEEEDEEDSDDEEENISSGEDDKDNSVPDVKDRLKPVKVTTKATKHATLNTDSHQSSDLNLVSLSSHKNSSSGKITNPAEKEGSVEKVKDVSRSHKKSRKGASAELSEFVAEASDTNDSSGNDSYDSDLDSSDFRLVAKKLALKAAKQMGNAGQFSESSYGSKPNTTAKESNKRRFDDVGDLIGITNHTSANKKRKDANFESANDDMTTAAVKQSSGVQSKLLSMADDEDDSEVKNVEETSTETKIMTKQETDNAKRLQAVKEQMQIRQRQKSWMKSALRNVDTASSKRIVFSSSEDEDDVGSSGDKGKVKQKVKPSKGKDKAGPPTPSNKKKQAAPSEMTLLGDSSEEDSDQEDLEEMFKSKPQFEGKKGEKLMKMQKKFGDSRFKLDAKFVDSDDSDDEADESDKEDGDGDKGETDQMSEKSGEDKAASLAAERKRNLQVLESVVGKNKVDRLTAKLKRDTIKIVDMTQLRFDPSKLKAVQSTEESKEKSSADKQEGSEKLQPQEESSKEKNQEEVSPEESEGPKQEVAKSKVTLSDSLVDMLKTKTKGELGTTGGEAAGKESSFSLLDMFDGTKQEDDEEESQSPRKPLAGLLTSKHKNNKVDGVKRDDVKPMDASDSEDDEEEDMEIEVEKKKKSVKPGPKSFMNLREDDSQNEDSTSSDDDDDDDDEDEKQDEAKDKTSTIDSIQSSFDPVKERENALRDAGRVDVRFTKEEWLERFSEIRHDLLLMCKKRYKDARKKKRVEDEHNRKKAVLKKAGKRGWWKKK